MPETVLRTMSLAEIEMRARLYFPEKEKKQKFVNQRLQRKKQKR